SQRIPSARMTSAMQSFVSASPSVGPYCNAFAHDSVAILCTTAANVSGGNVLVSGSPPASEMTSGRAVTAIRSRIADDFITRARADAGTNFSHTDWSWMESWVWIAVLAVFFLSGWLMDRGKRSETRPESNIGYGVLAGAMGALTFAASLAGGGHTAWPGLVGGA